MKITVFVAIEHEICQKDAERKDHMDSMYNGRQQGKKLTVDLRNGYVCMCLMSYLAPLALSDSALSFKQMKHLKSAVGACAGPCDDEAFEILPNENDLVMMDSDAHR